MDGLIFNCPLLAISYSYRKKLDQLEGTEVAEGLQERES